MSLFSPERRIELCVGGSLFGATALLAGGALYFSFNPLNNQNHLDRGTLPAITPVATPITTPVVLVEQQPVPVVEFISPGQMASWVSSERQGSFYPSSAEQAKMSPKDRVWEIEVLKILD